MSRMSPPPLPAETQAILDGMIHDPDGSSPKLYLGMAHHPAILRIFGNTGTAMRESTLLPAPDRELIIHRVAARCNTEYEWGIHAKLLAEPLGLSEAWLRATWLGTPSDFEDPAHAVLCQAVDELHDNSRLTDATFTALRDRYTEAQVVEILFMVGYYHLVCFTENVFDLAAEPWGVPVPSSTPND